MRFRSVLLLILLTAPALWASQLRQLAIIDLRGEPGFEQAVFANGMLVLAHESSDRLDIFDPARRRLVAEVPGMASPHGLAVDAREQKVYVANSQAGSIAVVSARDWKLERTIALPLAPYSLTVAPDGGTLYVANWQDQSVSAVNLTAGDKVSTAEVGGSPQALLLDSALSKLFVSLQDTAEVVALDPATLKITNRYKLSASQPTGMVADATGRRLFVAVRHAIVELDAATGSEVARAAAPAGADSLWLDPASGVLYVASSGGYVDLYNTAGKLAALEEIRTEVRGHTLAYDPARKLVFLPGGREGRSKLLILKNVLPAAPSTPAEQVAAK